MSTDDKRDMLTAKEVAMIFDVTVRTLRRWTARGWLHPMRMGVRIRFRREEINRCLDRGQIECNRLSGQGDIEQNHDPMMG